MLLHKIHFLYHVTKLDDNKFDEIFNEGIASIKAFKADDETYDKQLQSNKKAPPVVFFSASLYKGDLPTFTKYPRNSTDLQVFNRLEIDAREILGSKEDKKQIFFVSAVAKEGITQALLVVPQNKQDAEFCKQYFKEKEVWKYLHHHNGNWYSHDYANMKVMVNIAVMGNVQAKAIVYRVPYWSGKSPFENLWQLVEKLKEDQDPRVKPTSPGPLTILVELDNTEEPQVKQAEEQETEEDLDETLNLQNLQMSEEETATTKGTSELKKAKKNKKKKKK